MSTYTLKINFDTQGLQALTQAGQKVTIVKQTGAGGQPIAWITFVPQQSNQVIWQENYNVYASTTNITAGAKILTVSSATAISGSSYTVNPAGYFNTGVSGAAGVGPNDYQIVNGDPNLQMSSITMITAGLQQSATVNGNQVAAPMCASGVLFNQTALFTPIETIQVFTSSYSNNGMVIASVSGAALTVQYTTQPTATIAYNDTQNQFTLTGFSS
jgi:hypothetical protein